MAYPLNTFNADPGTEVPRTGILRFAQEVVLVIGLAVIIFLVMALSSYSAQDAAWSTSGAGGSLHNWAGKLGAWLADLAYVLMATYMPDLMGKQVFGSVNVGVVLGFAQFATTFLITWIYIKYANKNIEPRAAAIRQEMEG